jgi:chromosome segregation ATPase
MDEKNHSIIPIIVLFVAIGFIAGFVTTEQQYSEVERTLDTIEENNRELARRTKELQRRIGETEKRIAGAKTAVDDVRTDIGTVRGELVKNIGTAGRIEKGLSAVQDSTERSIGLTGTAEQIIEECISLVEKIENGEQD